MVRAARRHAGWSQRELAEHSGISPRTIAAIEAGQSQPRITVLRDLLDAVGLELALTPARDPIDDPELTRHLRLSLTQRLRLALGESPALAASPRGARWTRLEALAQIGQVALVRPVAVALWLPLGQVTPLRVELRAADRDDLDARVGAAEAADIEVTRLPGTADPFRRPVTPSLVPVMLSGPRRVWVPPPGELQHEDEESGRLRRADQLLQTHAPVDDAGRRRPAHRDPDEYDEEGRLLVTKSMGNRPRPDPRDSRAWRLGAPASLAQRLRAG
jgi:transcriptional regulator with XRE-family HTH domain